MKGGVRASEKTVVEAERDYHNNLVDLAIRSPQRKYYWATGLALKSHEQKTLERIAGKRVLEIGCFDGRASEEYAPRCASFVGVDVSDKAIAVAKGRTIEKARFQCCDAHELPFPENSFDVVIASGVLHHLDLEVALSEIGRVLAEGGALIFFEPLGINPLFRAYRFLTPSARTKDEHPFSFRDLTLMRDSYELKDVQFSGFTNIFSAFVRHPSLRAWLTNFDSLFAKTKLRYFFWQFMGCAVLRGE